MPSLREYAARWGVTPERLRPGQKVMHPGPMNRGVEIDPRRRGRGRRADRDAGARRARRPDGRPLRPAHDRSGADQGARPAGGGVMLYGKERTQGRPRRPRRARARPGRGRGRGLRRPRRRRHDRPARRRSSTRTSTASSTATGLVLAPAFVDPHVHLRVPGRRGRGDDRLRDRGRRGRRLLRDPRDAEHRAGRRLGRGARLADRGREGAGASIPVGFLAAITRGQDGAELTEMAELADQGAAGFTDDGRPVVAPGLMRRALQYHGDHRPAARAALRGADALEGRPDARGRGLGRARLHRLPVGGREPDGRARPLARRLRGRAAAPAAPLGARVGRARCGRRRRRASRQPPRSRRTTSA